MSRLARGALVAVPLAFVCVFFVYPVATIVATGLRPHGSFDLTPLADVVGDGHLRSVAWFTLWQAVVSTALTVIVAMPGAYVLARYDFPGRRVVLAAVTVPFVLPTLVAGTAFLAVGFDRGVIAILAAHVFFNYAVVVRTVGGLWAHLDPRLEEAARTLGASRWRAFREVTLPLLRPAIAAASSIVFLFTFTSFGVVLLLGGPAHATVEVEIYRQTRQLLDLPVASALALVQLVGVSAVLVVYSRYQQRRAVQQRLLPAREGGRRATTARERLLVAGNLLVMVVLLGVPVCVLALRSVRPNGRFGLGFYRDLASLGRRSVLFVPPVDAIANSLAYAAVATVIALVVGGLGSVAIARWRAGVAGRSFDALLMLPLGTSAVTVGFGFLVALDERPLDLRRSWWIVPIAHALVATPFVVRTVLPVLRSIDQRLRDAAAVLGASPRQVWREIDLPMMSRALLVAAGFGFAVSLGEFGATAFVARADRPTVPTTIARLLGQPGSANFGQALALSTILMVVTAVSLGAIERFRAGPVGEF